MDPATAHGWFERDADLPRPLRALGRDALPAARRGQGVARLPPAFARLRGLLHRALRPRDPSPAHRRARPGGLPRGPTSAGASTRHHRARTRCCGPCPCVAAGRRRRRHPSTPGRAARPDADPDGFGGEASGDSIGSTDSAAATRAARTQARPAATPAARAAAAPRAAAVAAAAEAAGDPRRSPTAGRSAATRCPTGWCSRRSPASATGSCACRPSATAPASWCPRWSRASASSTATSAPCASSCASTPTSTRSRCSSSATTPT